MKLSVRLTVVGFFDGGDDVGLLVVEGGGIGVGWWINGGG